MNLICTQKVKAELQQPLLPALRRRSYFWHRFALETQTVAKQVAEVIREANPVTLNILPEQRLLFRTSYIQLLVRIVAQLFIHVNRCM